MRDLIREDAKRGFRLSQIENEGNDPVVTGESYGTPHDLATIYGAREQGDVPAGYDERDPQPEGKPREKFSILGTQKDPMGGRDRLGVHGMKGGFPSDNENVSEDVSKKKVQSNLKAKLVLTQNKNMFPTNKKTLIFEEKAEEQSDLLNEANIKDNLDN
jgi:hypothetical protein